VSRRSPMINYERIAAEATELARLFWQEIEVEFTQQIAQCQVGSPEHAMTMADTLTIETITNRGLGCLPLRNLYSFHRWVPPFEGRPQIVVQHLRPHLEQQMRALLGPAHLLFLDHPLAHYLVDG